MIWEEVAFCQWQAVGKNGTFFIWKDGRVWQGKYRNKEQQITAFLSEEKSLKAIKSACENHKYWE